MIALKHVAKTFGARLILRDCTAEFSEGSVSLLTGENGAGKSTLLRIVAGLSQPSSGHVAFAPEDPSIGFLGHQTFLYPALTALENLAFWQKA
ncbi:MAG: ATP-binding cassette domain-containing protein, partial [Desulfovibrio sp.]|nr:ATP-binding cassette domain-containing protein [Desulfovibrio sp.]